MRAIADRKEEFLLFERMLEGTDPCRILLLEGPSERGKSILLAELAIRADQILGKGCCARADLKGSLPLDDLFSGFCADLGPEILTNYAKRPVAPGMQIIVDTDLSGAEFRDANKIAVQPIIHTSSADSVQQRGDAVIKDLHACSKALVLIIDTFEAATDEAARWILQQFLPTVRHNSFLRIILGGQKVPDPRSSPLTWGAYARRSSLDPVTSVEDWHEFALSRHSGFPRHHIESVCMGGLVNRPSIIQEFIDNIIKQLPRDTAGGSSS